MEENENLIYYEYKSVAVSRKIEDIWRDSYKNLGWDCLHSKPLVVNLVWNKKVELRFKRDRNINNKGELNRLQMHFEYVAKVISKLEKSKTKDASIIAFITGILGTCFMAGSVFTYLAGLLLPCIVLVVPGFLGWILSYCVYKTVRMKRERRADPLIENHYECIYQICRKARRLL